MLRRYRHADDPRAGRITPDDFELRDSRPRGGARRVRDLPLPAELTVAAADATAARLPAMASSPGVESCAWCGSPLRQGAVRLRGRTRCPRCGAATTDPWPSDEELEDAYGTWYRPRVGPALLDDRRRAAQPHPSHPGPPPRRDRPPGPGARRRRRRRDADRRLGPPRPLGHRPRAGRQASPGARPEPRRGTGGVGGGRLLAFARAPPRARAGDPRVRPPAGLRRRRGRRGPEHRQPPGPRLRRPLASPRHPAPPRPPLGRQPHLGAGALRLSRSSASPGSAAGRS